LPKCEDTRGRSKDGDRGKQKKLEERGDTGEGSNPWFETGGIVCGGKKNHTRKNRGKRPREKMHTLGGCWQKKKKKKTRGRERSEETNTATETKNLFGESLKKKHRGELGEKKSFLGEDPERRKKQKNKKTH